MAKAYLGSTQLKKAYIGSTAIKKIYCGPTLIWAGYQDETLAQKARIEADGGVIIDLEWIDLVISTLKTLGIYGNAKLLTDANFGVKKDITGAVSKLYDISGNNNDAVQTTGASQPIWSLSGGKGIITYDGSDDMLNCASPGISSGSYTIRSVINPLSTNNYRTIMGSGTTRRLMIASTGNCYFQWGVVISSTIGDVVNGVTASLSYVHDATLLYNFIYKDNNNIKSQAFITYAPFTSAFKIGQYNGVDYKFKGQINSSTIFNIALTQDQITTLYNLGL